MRKKIGKIIAVLKKRKIAALAAVIVAITIIIIATGGNGAGSYDFIIAQRRDISQGVSITGTVKPVDSVDLAFEKTGTVAQVLADVGDSVTANQTLITLRNGGIIALLNQAEAQADVERAILSDLRANTKQDLQNSYNNALNTINDALAKAEDAVRSKTVGLFSGSESSGYNLTFSACSASTSSNAKTLRLTAELELDRWDKELNILGSSPSNSELDTTLFLAQQHLDVALRFVDSTNAALLTKCATENSTLDNGRVNMQTAQTNIATVIEKVNNLVQTIALNKISADNANDIAAQEAKVRAADASAQNYRAQLELTVIRSPIDGIVTKQDANIGETASINIPIVSVISGSSFEVEANIPEVEIAKVKTGDKAVITLDAYGDNEFFEAHIVAIDPAETIIGGAPNYRTTLIFDKEDERIKSGMTASIDIAINNKPNVIAIPKGSIKNEDGRKIVRIIIGERRKAKLVEAEVTTGIVGSDGFIEITSGINEGDRVVLSVEE